MSTTSVYLLHDTQGELSLTGEPVRADGWYGWKDGLHTISVHYQNFVGKFFIEASLADEPTDEDWFPVWLTSQVPYVEYPINPARPTGTIGFKGDTGSDAFTFEGNFTWLRARVDRSYIEPQPEEHDDIARLGVVKKVLLNH